MNLFGFVKRSVLYYRRRNVGLLLTAIVSAAVLAGALFVGDSVDYSLRRIVELRLGKTDTVLIARDGFFGISLADRLGDSFNADSAAVLQLSGMISSSDGSERISSANINGVGSEFFAMGSADNPFAKSKDGVVVNRQAADRLGVKAGDEVLLRIGKPGSMSRDIGLMPDSELTVSYRAEVISVIGDDGFGRFGLAANQSAPYNVFVPSDLLGKRIERAGLCNTILLGEGDYDEAKRDAALKEAVSLEDMGLELNDLADKGEYDLRSRRVFIDDRLADAAMKVDGAAGYLTYFVNEIRHKDSATPYSMVTGMSGSDLDEDDIIINRWLAEDIGVEVGGTVELEYFVPAENRQLKTERKEFTVTEIVENENAIADRELMPDFPGLADAENCSEWDPGIPVDLDRIRDKDEKYWDDYRGTPKAFVSLAAGRSMWANRFGNLTSVRYPAKGSGKDEIAADILENVDPSWAGLVFLDVRKQGLKAGSGSTDFGQLFLGLSMFLIAAGMILTGLVFAFGVEKRRQEAGILLAAGYSKTLVKRMLFIESAVIALAGSVLGAIAGLLYTRLMIAGLSSVWQEAVASANIVFHWNVSTLLIGIVCGFSVSMFSVWLTLRRHLRESAHELLSLTAEHTAMASRGGHKDGKRFGLWMSAIFAIAAVVIIVVYRGGDSAQAAAGAFFGAGSLLLISGIMFFRSLLKDFGAVLSGTFGSVKGFAWKNASRRPGRSVAVVSMLAAGTFVVVSIGAFRHGPMSNMTDRDSGTGGFVLFAETSVPVVVDLDSKAEKEKLGLGGEQFEGLRVVQMRVRQGDNASCLNLNRAQRPTVVGVDPRELERRGAFGEIKTADGIRSNAGWQLLGENKDDDIVNAIADNSTVIWAMGKKLGDTVEYVDDNGRSFKVRIAGIIGNSILQGNLLISEYDFTERFGRAEGYRMFLVDAPVAKSEKIADKLSSGLVDYGIDITTTAGRLARFSAVENTYLSIFQILGGLGVLIGSVGLGLIVNINVLERRGELAMLRAVGFNKKLLNLIVTLEHLVLLFSGLVLGIAAAVIAVLPALQTPGTKIEIGFVAIILALITFFSIIVIRISTVFALRGRLIDALRSE